MKTISDIKSNCVNLFNQEHCCASESLLNEVLDVCPNNERYINLAYTDYGGTYIEKIFIQYMEDHFPNNIVVENTSWCGKNAIIFGEIVPQIIEATSDYILGFDDFEDYYIEKQMAEKEEAAIQYIEENCIEENKQQKVIDFFIDNSDVCTFGVDYSPSQLEELLK